MNIELRGATESDREAVEELLAACGLLSLDPGAQFGVQYAVAASDGGLAGVAGVEVYGDDGLLRSVAVAQEGRGEGIGLMLASNRIAWARRRGLRSLYLLTMTARDFFARLGFEVIARDSAPAGIASSYEWRTHCPASAVAMRLVLHQQEQHIRR